MKYLGLIILLLSLSVSCKQASDKDKEKDAIVEIVEPTKLPSIPTELLQQIFMECDFVDYIFYELPFSMSYDQKSTIQSALRWVNSSTEIPTSGCKALGRMIFQNKGEVMIEAELYVTATATDTCAYYKWIQNSQPVYTNLMSQNGIVHYSGIIKQFEAKNLK